MALPANLILAKNSIDCKYPWLLLVKFSLYAGTPEAIEERFVRNFKDIIFQGKEWKGFNFSIGLIEESSDGGIPTTSLAVCNVTQYLQPLLEAHEGFIDATITIIIVHADLLEEDYAELEQTFDVIAPHLDADIVVFQLGAPSLLRRRYPSNRTFSDLCSYKFKDFRCGYSGNDELCNHRLVDCRLKNNSVRFGGSPGMRD